MHQRAFIHLITLTIVLCPSAGELVITPRATEAKVGDTTYFNCSTNLTDAEIFWEHNNEYIYTGDVILDPYHGRFEIDRIASNGSHNLVIYSVKPGDAGQYICVDNDGDGKRQSAQLIVLDDEPECRSNIKPDGVIGQNTFNIPPDEVQLTCSVTYHGNLPPQMEWKKFGDINSIREGVMSNISSNHSIYTLKLNGEISLDRSSYVCQTTRSTMNQYKCKSEIINVLYFDGGSMIVEKVFKGDEITCTASSNTFPCHNQWHHGNSISHDTITADLLGEYLCVVKCHIRGTNYTFEARKVLVAEVATSTTATFVVPVVAVILAILAISIAVLVIYCMRKKVKKDARRIEHLRCIILQELEENEELHSYIDSQIGHKEEVANECKVAEEETELLFQIKKVGTEKTINGVAILSKKLFLIHEQSSYLEVYDCSGLATCTLLHVKEVVSAVDICSCKQNNCLYIMDKKNPNLDSKVRKKAIIRQVFKINAQGKSLDDWSTKDNACGFLSATREGNVIITDQDKHRFLEYSSDGDLLRDVDLSSCPRPWHTIKVDDGKYIVSHGTYDKPHRVLCLLDRNGTVDVEKKFGSETHGSAENQLHIPYYLADTDNGYVLVADLCNHRVLLLDDNLKFKTKIVPKYEQRFLGPRRMCLDEKLLVVVITAGDPKNEQTTAFREESLQNRYLLDQNTKDKEVLVEVEGVTNTLLSNVEDNQIGMVNFSRRIEKDCRVLVFDVQQLLKRI